MGRRIRILRVFASSDVLLSRDWDTFGLRTHSHYSERSFTFPDNVAACRARLSNTNPMRLSSFADRYVSERVRPFFFLSYPVAKSPPAVSPYWSRYYTSGLDDVCLLLGWGTILVISRWVLLALFGSFARWWLSSTPSPVRPERKKGHNFDGDASRVNGVPSTSNGHTIGNDARLRIVRQSEALNGLATDLQRHKTDRASRKALAARERKATRFAEQGAAFVYYTIAWLFGVVRAHVLPLSSVT